MWTFPIDTATLRGLGYYKMTQKIVTVLVLIVLAIALTHIYLTAPAHAQGQSYNSVNAGLPVAFATLSCGATTEGRMYAISDSNTVTWGANVAGGSTSHVLGYCDGTNITVAAK